MAKSRVSAGLLMYRKRGGVVEVLLVHPGGPFFKNKDNGAWSIPKGEPDEGEELLATAQREVMEEVGVTAKGPFVELKPVTQKGGKVVHAWACEADCEAAANLSNTFTMEWPPKSGKQVAFPEIDRAVFLDVATAKEKIKDAQVALIEELEGLLK